MGYSITRDPIVLKLQNLLNSHPYAVATPLSTPNTSVFVPARVSDAASPLAHTVRDQDTIIRSDENCNSSVVSFPPTFAEVSQPPPPDLQPPAAEVVLDTVFCLEEAIETRKAILVSLGYTLTDACCEPAVLNLLNRLRLLKPQSDNSRNDELLATEVSDSGVFNANVSFSPLRESLLPPFLL
jgi:hypothetical protein